MNSRKIVCGRIGGSCEVASAVRALSLHPFAARRER